MISFIVPAHNEELLLGPTLRAIHAAARALGEPYELVVADDASTDGTALVAGREGARVCRVAHRQISATRNAGARAASGDKLFFVDADTFVNPAVVRAAFHALQRGAVGGGALFRFEGRLPLWVRITEPLALAFARRARLAAGCFFFCRRDAFEEVGGFDTRVFAGEEIYASLALKRVGRFVILRESVRTSGRKLRAHRGREHLAVAMRYFSRGRKSVESREGLDLWYGARRHDPERAA